MKTMNVIPFESNRSQSMSSPIRVYSLNGQRERFISCRVRSWLRSFFLRIRSCTYLPASIDAKVGIRRHAKRDKCVIEFINQKADCVLARCDS